MRILVAGDSMIQASRVSALDGLLRSIIIIRSLPRILSCAAAGLTSAKMYGTVLGITKEMLAGGVSGRMQTASLPRLTRRYAPRAAEEPTEA